MPVQLTVATFNIRNGRAPDRYNHWLLRRRTTARWFRGLNAHVVGLQEVYPFQRRYLSRRWPGASVAGRGRDAGGGGEQVPVFVHRPFVIDAVRYRWFSATPEVPGSLLGKAKMPRMATIVTVLHPPTGTRFRVVNVHLDHRFEANRRASAVQIVRDELDDDLPTVLLGDFNADPERSVLYQDLEDGGFRRLAYDGTSFNGWRHTLDHRDGQLDQILLRDGGGLRWEAGYTRLVWSPMGRVPSDHWPLLAPLTLG